MRRLICILMLAVAFSVILPKHTHAQSLKIAPLEYRTSLKQAEKKKGFIDISNPTGQNVTIKTSTQAFRQIDDEGTIQFYDDEQISKGVLLDVDEFKLGPKEAIRMYFLLDGAKLPTGDVFGAIFFTTTPSEAKAGVGQSVRLGTVFSIVNGTPGSRQAAITSLDMPGFSFNPQIKGTYAIKNTADPQKTTGFYPQVNVKTTPFGGTKELAGKLVFAGRTRTNDFSVNLPPIGIYRVEARYGVSHMSKWVIVAHPPAIVAVVTLLLASVLIRRYIQRRKSVGFRNS